MAASEPRRDERFAFEIVRQVTGATVLHADIPSAGDGTIDAWIEYPDGRRGALEVTTVGDSAEFQLRALLERHKGEFPNPGKNLWEVAIGHATEFPRVRAMYARAILLMEALGIDSADQLPDFWLDDDRELQWLVDDSESSIRSYPSIPKGKREHVILAHPAVGAFWESDGDAILSGLRDSLIQPVVKHHVAKLLRHEASERHLFLISGFTGLTPAAVVALIGPESVPQEDPVLPNGITHLWLTAGYGQQILFWRRGLGWAIESFA